jgi:hypothetical protein
LATTARRMRPWSAWMASLEPRARLAASVALFVASSQPLYPLYVIWIAGPAASRAWATLSSTPAFLAVAAGARRWPRGACLTLPIIGAANTAVGVWALGAGSGVEMLLLPCVLLAALLFAPEERAAPLLALAATAAVYWVADPSLSMLAPAFPEAALSTLRTLHALGAAGITVFIGRMARPA